MDTQGNRGPVDPLPKAQSTAFLGHRPQLAQMTLPHLRPWFGKHGREQWLDEEERLDSEAGALGLNVATFLLSTVPPKGQGTDKGRVLVKGQDPVRGQDPVKTKDLLKVPVSTKPGSCPNILMRCAMMNPPNRCLRDTECPGAKKCCHGPCGLACLDPQ